MVIRSRIRLLVSIILLLLFLFLVLYAMVYQRYFRYYEVSRIMQPNGGIVTLLRDELISGDMSYEDCGCSDESYFVLKMNDKIVYRFYIGV
jgi:hypothetical protein